MSTSEHSPRAYYWTYAALLVLLVLTYVVAQFNFGAWNMVVSMTVAVLKAVLVLWVFMHVRESSRAVWVFAGAGFLWLALLLVLSLGDYVTR